MKDTRYVRWFHFARPVIVSVVIAAAAAGHVFAAYNITISGSPSSNGSWSGGSPEVWTPSGTGSNVNAADIEAWLNSGIGVTINAAGGGTENGDILVKDALSWNAGALTLNAAGNININAVMAVSGTSMLAMTTGTSGAVKAGFAAGQCNGFAGRVDFTGRSGTGILTINGAGYTVIGSLGAAGSTTGTDLQGISGALDGHYALGANINASATATWNWDGGSSSYLGFLPLGSTSTPFTGVFDGLGHTVSNLTINRPSANYAGLFGYTYAAKLRNVGLPSVTVSATGYVGALVGASADNAGAVGVINNAYVDNPANSDGHIIGTGSEIGGLAGENNVKMSDIYSRTCVGSNNAQYTGGLVGYNLGPLSNAYHIGVLINGYLFVGGLAGCNSGAITNAYASNVTIRNTVSPFNYVGGLIGWNAGAVTNSYVGAGGTLQATVSYTTGGLVGDNNTGGTIINCYAAGGPVAPSGGANDGGMVGTNYGTVTNSFWNMDTTGRTASAAGTGLTTAQMVLLATFSAPNTTPSWDIDDAGGTGKIWRIYDTHTYPLLRSFLAPLAVTANDDTRPYTGAGYSGGNGVTYSPTSYDASNVFGTVTYGGSSQGATALGTYVITPGGLWSNQPGYDIGYVSGKLTITAAVVGRVPDGAPGTPLLVALTGSKLSLTWGASCGYAATDYAVYEGTLGTWYSHHSMICSTSGALTEIVSPSPGNHYYLIVPLSPLSSKEGSYGTRSSGAEIPQGSTPCWPSQDTSPCN